MNSSCFSCVVPTGEPDSPVLSSDEMKIEGNTFSVPLKHTVDGGSPVLQLNVRYRQVRDSMSLSLCLSPSTHFPRLSPLVALLSLTRIKKRLSGRNCRCHLMLTLFPSKTWLLAQTISWKSQQSMPTVPPYLQHSTSPSQNSLVCGLLSSAAYTELEVILRV